MKTKLLLTVLTSFLLLTGCSSNDDNVEESGLASKGSTLSKTDGSKSSSSINQTFPQAQAEVLETFGAIAQSIMDGAGHGSGEEYMDQLISFHAYGDKFVEFNDGNVYDSGGNETNERTFFGEKVKIDGVRYFNAAPGTLKVAVYYGNVANLTFVSDFILILKDSGEEIRVNNLITLLFVKTNGEWKMVHEHHSLYQGDEIPYPELPDA